MKPPDAMAKRFPNPRARKAADEAAEAAWTREPGITLLKVCAIWNDTYAAHAPHPFAGKH